MDSDPRHDELETLTAIYPEIQISDHDPYTFSIEIPVNPLNPVVVSFPSPTPVQQPGPDGAETDSHHLAYLPSLVLTIALPSGYPSSKPPNVTIHPTLNWMPEGAMTKLQNDAVQLWEEMGRDQVVFSYIDQVRQAAEDVFGMVNETGTLELDSSHKIAVLDYDINAKRVEFEKQTYDCPICLEPKKGSVCHKMLDCGHIFCVECLQDTYQLAIKEGAVNNVRCLDPTCAQEREKAASSKKRRKAKHRKQTQISPSELLQVPILLELVQRYVALTYKVELESDKDTVYCPRKWCQGAARSKKHKKPDGLELNDLSDSESGSDSEGEGKEGQDGETLKDEPDPEDPEDLLAICEDCGYAFCRRCRQSWHGEYKTCQTVLERRAGEISKEEAATEEYIRMHTTPCPTCEAPCQKTMGCNHMNCFRCQTHFCYLCSTWLDPQNPYRHFNVQEDGKKTGCFNRLWELEEGDGDDVDIGFAGGRRAAPQGNVRGGNRGRGQRPGPRPIPPPEIEEPDSEDDAPEERQQRNNTEDNRRVEVAREGPLVLRIDGPRQGRGGPRNRAVEAHQVAPQFNQQQNRGGRGAPAQARGQGRGRGRGRGGRVLALQHNRQGQQRQNNDGHQQRPPQQQENRQQQPQALEEAVAVAAAGEGLNVEDLDPAQEAWIRLFVQLALNDEEDLIDLDE